MKTINTYLTERLKLSNKTYKYCPEDWMELKYLIPKLIEGRGNDADLNDIDTSKITNMNQLFYTLDFNGDISKWNVSNVKSMERMFKGSKFDGDISNWDVSNVEDMFSMFKDSEFTGKNGDISNWNVSKVKNMNYMFKGSKFKGNIDNWDVRKVKDILNSNAFDECPLEYNPPKWYKE